MPEGQFAYFRFVGNRFKSGEGMPLEALAELVVYRELVVDVARDLWKRSNPDRQRAPKNFSASLDLVVTRFDDGSIRPFVERRERTPSMFDDWFDQSREVVTGAVTSAATSGVLPAGFPRACVPKLSRLGRSLEAGDRFQFGHPTVPEQRTELNRATADILRKIGEELSTETPDMRVRGHIVEMDVETETFQLRTSDHRRVQSWYAPEDAERVHDWLGVDDDDGVLVEVKGRALVDAEGAVQRFVGPTTIREIPLEGILAVFTTLAEINEQSPDVPISMSRLVLDRSELLARHHPRFGVAPMPDGTLRIEWDESGRPRSAELSVDGDLYLHDFDPRTRLDAEWEGTADEIGLAKLEAFLEGGFLD